MAENLPILGHFWEGVFSAWPLRSKYQILAAGFRDVRGNIRNTAMAGFT